MAGMTPMGEMVDGQTTALREETLTPCQTVYQQAEAHRAPGCHTLPDEELLAQLAAQFGGQLQDPSLMPCNGRSPATVGAG